MTEPKDSKGEPALPTSDHLPGQSGLRQAVRDEDKDIKHALCLLIPFVGRNRHVQAAVMSLFQALRIDPSKAGLIASQQYIPPLPREDSPPYRTVDVSGLEYGDEPETRREKTG